MHQATGNEIKEAESLVEQLDIATDQAFSEHGPDSKEFLAVVHAAAEFIGWLYVVKKSDEVRRDLEEVKRSARFRFVEYGSKTPSFLRD